MKETYLRLKQHLSSFVPICHSSSLSFVTLVILVFIISAICCPCHLLSSPFVVPVICHSCCLSSSPAICIFAIGHPCCLLSFIICCPCHLSSSLFVVPAVCCPCHSSFPPFIVFPIWHPPSLAPLCPPMSSDLQAGWWCCVTWHPLLPCEQRLTAVVQDIVSWQHYQSK